MSDVIDEAQAIVQCKACPWYKACVLPLRVTEYDLKKQIETSIGGAGIRGAPYDMSQFLSNMANAAQNSLLEGCPIFIERLRSNPKLAERIKTIMREWSSHEESGSG